MDMGVGYVSGLALGAGAGLGPLDKEWKPNSLGVWARREGPGEREYVGRADTGARGREGRGWSGGM